MVGVDEKGQGARPVDAVRLGGELAQGEDDEVGGAEHRHRGDGPREHPDLEAEVLRDAGRDWVGNGPGVHAGVAFEDGAEALAPLCPVHQSPPGERVRFQGSRRTAAGEAGARRCLIEEPGWRRPASGVGWRAAPVWRSMLPGRSTARPWDPRRVPPTGSEYSRLSRSRAIHRSVLPAARSRASRPGKRPCLPVPESRPERERWSAAQVSDHDRDYDYDLFVIGAGSGGTRAARIAAGFGARVAVAEERFLGGTCVNVGCIPKKLFVYASHFAEDFEDAAGFGWRSSGGRRRTERPVRRPSTGPPSSPTRIARSSA